MKSRVIKTSEILCRGSAVLAVNSGKMEIKTIRTRTITQIFDSTMHQTHLRYQNLIHNIIAWRCTYAP